MATQNDASVAAPSEAATGHYPNYDQDVDTFSAFLTEHRILRVVHDNDTANDENRMFEPVSADSDFLVERVPCYHPLFQRIVDREYTENSSVFLIEIPLSELVEWNAIRGADLAQRAADNTLRYQALFASVIDLHLKGIEPSPQSRVADGTQLRDTFDILQEHREAAQQRARQEQQLQRGGDVDDTAGVDGDAAVNGNNANSRSNNPNLRQDFPPQLMRRYELRILPLGRRGTLFPFYNQYIPPKTALPPPVGVSLRHVRSKSMGRLVTITGMVVRATDVKPFCHVATYTCDVCGVEVYQPLNNQREFMPQRFCPICAQRANNNSVGPSLQLQTRGSKFVKFQELKVQELPSQVPMGHIPRSLSVYCRGELTRQANPGDVITVDGVFLPQRVAESGYRAMKAGLMATLYVEAQHLVVHKRSLDQSLLDSLAEEEAARVDADITRVANSPDPIGILSQSIAPEIFGHADIKRALLLQLTGGVCRKLKDGMKIRGDINICLMGDPGVAKSQLLKHVASIAPRGVYTTGKGSSGVGLTAAVTKDTVTGELSLEGGALVLADRGICAIDEFDKMDESDRTAIHEVMEQQTVSIAKAGIVATLNARAAVLAAANPLYSRYNRRKSLSENINLPNSLLSRFDLMFLILDTPDMDKDMALARHVTFVHQNEGLEAKQDGDEDDNSDDEDDKSNSLEAPPDYDEDKGIVTPRLLREYISRARRHEPVVPPHVAPYVVEAYVALRLEDRPGRRGGKGNNPNSKANDQTVMTARQLLSILRLSQALARLRFSDHVAQEDVDEAIRLTHMSKASLTEDGSDGSGKNKPQTEDFTTSVFTILRDYATASSSTTLDIGLCEGMVLRKGFTKEQLQSALEQYEGLEIIQVNSARTQVHFLS